MSFFCPISLGKKFAWNNNNNYKVPKDQPRNKWGLGLKTGACDEDFCPYQTSERTLDKYGIDTNSSLPRRGCHPTKLELAGLLEGASIDNPADVTAVMLWSYMPSHATDIPVSKGEKVTVFYRNGDWAFVKNSKDGQGFVPLNYCTLRRRNSLTESPMVLMRNLGKVTVAKTSKQDTSPNVNSNKVTVKSARNMGETDHANKTLSRHGGHKKLPLVVKETSEWLKLFQYDNSDTDSTDSSDDDMFRPADIFGRISVNFELHGKTLSRNYTRKTKKPKDVSVKASLAAGNNDHVINTQNVDTKQICADRKYLTLPNGFDAAAYLLPNTLGIKPTETKCVNTSVNFPEIQTLQTNTAITNSDKTITNSNDLNVLFKSESQSVTKFESQLGPKCESLKVGNEVIAVFDFVATTEHDLNLKTGQKAHLLNKSDDTWWWVRDAEGHEGFVPKNYLIVCSDEASKSSVNKQTLESSTYANHIKVEHPLHGHVTAKEGNTSHDTTSIVHTAQIVPNGHIGTSFPHIKNGTNSTMINSLHACQERQPIQHHTNESDLAIETRSVRNQVEEKAHLQHVDFKGLNQEIVTPNTTVSNCTDCGVSKSTDCACAVSVLENGMKLVTVSSATHHSISDSDKPAGRSYHIPLDLTRNSSHANANEKASENVNDELMNIRPSKPILTSSSKPHLPSYEELMSNRTDTLIRDRPISTSTCSSQERHDNEYSTPKVWLTESLYDNKPRVLRRRQTIASTSNKRVRFQEMSSDSEDSSQEPLVSVHRYNIATRNENHDTTLPSTCEGSESARFTDFVKVNAKGETEIGTWC